MILLHFEVGVPKMATFVNKLSMERFDQKILWYKQNNQEWLYFLSINIFAVQTTKGLCIYSPQAVEQKKEREKIDQFDPFDLLMTPFVPNYPKRPNWEFKKNIIVCTDI